jgi:hypothetical protein
MKPFSDGFATVVLSKWMGDLKDEHLRLSSMGPAGFRIEDPELATRAPA